MFEALIICLVVALLLTGFDGCGEVVRRAVNLGITSINYRNRPHTNMPTALQSSVSQFAELVLDPVDAGGLPVKLDDDAIVVEVIRGAEAGAKAAVVVLDLPDGRRRFFVNVAPTETPGESEFLVRGDLEPGAGISILEETFIYTATPNNAVSLGITVNYLPRNVLPVSFK